MWINNPDETTLNKNFHFVGVRRWFGMLLAVRCTRERKPVGHVVIII